MSICGDGDFLNVLRIIFIIYRIIQVLVPLFLIYMISFDFYTVISKGKDDELKKTFQTALKRLIAALIILFMPTIIHITLRFINANYASCISNANASGIETAYENSAQEAIEKAKSSNDLRDYKRAKYLVNRIKNDNIREEYNKELEEIYVAIKSTTETASYVTAKPKVEIEPGTHDKTFTSSSGKEIQYWEVIPEGATANMPLFLYLHGDGNTYRSIVDDTPLISWLRFDYKWEQKFILIAPYDPCKKRSDGACVSNWAAWETQNVVKELMDKVIEDYQSDKDHIVIAGMSRGAIGTWGMVARYKSFFSAAAPMSCGAYDGVSNDGADYKDVPIWALSGDTGDAEITYKTSMQALVNKINAAGGNAKMTVFPGESHNTVGRKFRDYPGNTSGSEIINWLMTQ